MDTESVSSGGGLDRLLRSDGSFDDGLSLASESLFDEGRTGPRKLSRKRRSERLQRTRALLSAINPAAASAVLPSEELSEADRAAVVLQKYIRRFLARREYARRLYDKFEQEEMERLQRQQEQVDEGEMLIAIARLQMEVDEEQVCSRNRQRYLNACATRIQHAWRAHRRQQMEELFPLDDESEIRVNPFSSSEEASRAASYQSPVAHSPDSEDGDMYVLATLEGRLDKLKAREELIQKMINDNILQGDDESSGSDYSFSDFDEGTFHSEHHHLSNDFQICFDDTESAFTSEGRGTADGASIDSAPLVDSSPDLPGSGSIFSEGRKVLGKEDDEKEITEGIQENCTFDPASRVSRLLYTWQQESSPSDYLRDNQVAECELRTVQQSFKQQPCLTRQQLQGMTTAQLQRLKEELQLSVKGASDELVSLLTLRDDLAYEREKKNTTIQRLSIGFQQQKLWLKAAKTSHSYRPFVRREKRRGWLKKL